MQSKILQTAYPFAITKITPATDQKENAIKRCAVATKQTPHIKLNKQASIAFWRSLITTIGNILINFYGCEKTHTKPCEATRLSYEVVMIIIAKI